MRVQHTCRQRNRNDVVAGGPEQVLNHLAVRRLTEINQVGDVGGFAVDQDNVGGFGGSIALKLPLQA